MIETRLFTLADVAALWPRLHPRLRPFMGDDLAAYLDETGTCLTRGPACTLFADGQPIAALGLMDGRVWGLFTRDCAGHALALVRAIQKLRALFDDLTLYAVDAESRRFATLFGFKETPHVQA